MPGRGVFVTAARPAEDWPARLAAAHHPVPSDQFAEFAPAPRQALIDLLALVEAAGRAARVELTAIQGKLGRTPE